MQDMETLCELSACFNSKLDLLQTRPDERHRGIWWNSCQTVVFDSNWRFYINHSGYFSVLVTHAGEFWQLFLYTSDEERTCWANIWQFGSVIKLQMNCSALQTDTTGSDDTILLACMALLSVTRVFTCLKFSLSSQFSLCDPSFLSTAWLVD